jgi:spore maturation protein CgeB
VKTLFVALRHDYGDPARGDSFEFESFLPALKRVNSEVVYFAFDALLGELDYFAMNRRLRAVVDDVQPDLMFCILFENQLDRKEVQAVTQTTPTKTFNWFCDDHWRYRDFSRYWAGCFDTVGTTSRDAYEWYQRDGFDNVIKTQWAVDESRLLPRPPLVSEYLSFVGQRRPERSSYIDFLNRARIPVRAFGSGWPAGRLPLALMQEVSRSSAANLNFTESTAVHGRGRVRQVKARPFELGAAGRPVLTERNDELDEYYAPGEEVLTFSTRRELLTHIRHLASDRVLAETLGQRVFERTRLTHTYTHRLLEILGRLNLETSVHDPGSCRVSVATAYDIQPVEMGTLRTDAQR